jgi:hypothetical protein
MPAPTVFKVSWRSLNRVLSDVRLATGKASETMLSGDNANACAIVSRQIWWLLFGAPGESIDDAGSRDLRHKENPFPVGEANRSVIALTAGSTVQKFARSISQGLC